MLQDNFHMQVLLTIYLSPLPVMFLVYSGLESVLQIQQTDSSIKSQLFVCLWSFSEFPEVK